MGRQEGKAIGPAGLEKRLVLHSLCQLASWAFVAVLITVLPRVGGENSPCGTISSGTFHQQENNCLPPQLGWDSHQAALGQDPREAAQCACSCARSTRRGSHPPLLRAAQKGRAQCPGPVPRCQGRQRQTKSGAVGFSRGHGWARREGELFNVPGSSRRGGGVQDAACFILGWAG